MKSVRYLGETAAPVDAQEFRSAMRNVAGTVSIVATGTGKERRGLTVTSACSVSTEPPSVLVCVNHTAEAHDFIERNQAFSLNVLSADQIHLAEKFSARDGSRGADRFRDGEWEELVTGAPILTDALANFDCHVSAAYKAGTHTLFVGTVIGERHRPDGAALLYVRGEFAKPHSDFKSLKS